MTDKRDDDKRIEAERDREQVKDLRTKPVDEKEAQQVKGGRLHGDDGPTE